ncbi:protein SHQ1 homolog isoform X1 [Hyalella azteca]|uniref:Protein SHQ1 homolog n=1 Tax=Hyalella azteca TaxID=294128 RepID=A0A8B7PLG0_HYAAZ|nr:protein SHQ1 homolog isoform X1 [Hyalella azteca]
MLTPVFKLSQDENSVTIIVHAPNARLQDTEVTAYNNLFYFTSAPYFLRLHLPHNLKDSELNGNCQASYDADSNSCIFKCLKEEPGQHFPGLDMLTDLLTPKTVTRVPNIEVLASSNEGSQEVQGATGENLVSVEEEFYEPQEIPKPLITEGPKYGFANKYSNVPAVQEGLYGVLDLNEPNTTSATRRRELRIQDETENFSSDHYLADMFEDTACSYMNFVPHFHSLSKPDVRYMGGEETALLQLPRREMLAETPLVEAEVCAGLVSLLLAWCYNHRITGAEDNVASAWNMAKLAPQLSWFDTPPSVRESVLVFTRRALVYPLLRHWDFNKLVVGDAVTLLKLGRKMVLKSLLEMRRCFNETENHYLLNDLYITDYCLWLQQRATDERLLTLASELSEVELSKSDVGFDLDILEDLARKSLQDSQSTTNEREAVAGVTESLQTLTFANPALTDGKNESEQELNVATRALSLRDNTNDCAPTDSDDSDTSDSSGSSDDGSSDSSSDSSSSSGSDVSSELDSDDDDEPRQRNADS